MAANINDKITSASSGVRPVNTTVSNIRNSGNTTLSCADLTGWPTASAVHFVTYKLDGTGNIVVGTQSDWKGIVSGVTITDLVLTGGSDNGNAIGDIVVCLPTARYGKELYDALSTEHKQNGTHKDITADSITVSGAVTTDTISEKTSANGVTIDGLNLKDGKLNTNDSVVTSNITDGAVTAIKTSFGGDYSTSEVGTGFKWVDNKVIYKKTVSMGALPNATTKTVAHGASIDSIVRVYGSASDGTTRIPLPYSDTTSAAAGVMVYLTGTNIVLGAGTNRSAYSGYVTLEYTKP